MIEASTAPTMAYLQRPQPLKARYFAEGKPHLLSQKIDGIRGVWRDGAVWSRQGQLIPNPHIQATVASWGLPHGVDGELFCGNLSLTQSRVMSKHGKPFFQFIAFASLTDTYNELKSYARKIKDFLVVPQIQVTSLQQVIQLHNKVATAGGEGVVVKTDEPYAVAECFKLKPHYIL